MAQHIDTEVAVIGGGIHGAGVAQACAAQGFEVALFERREWASGTSSRSSKLIHGGLRYLESAQLPLVWHSLRERRRLLQNAPELVKQQNFHIPIYKETRRRPWQIAAGLTLYRLLAGMEPVSRWNWQGAQAAQGMDGLQTDGLQALFCYHDGQTDDRALTRAVVRSAASLGAECFEGLELISGEIEEGYWKLTLAGPERDLTCRCKTLVNATGPWINEALNRLHCPLPMLDIKLVRGSHILLPGEMTKGIYYMESPADGRAIFAMPWQGQTLVGTTETPHQGNPDRVECSIEEEHYLQRAFMHYFPERDATVSGHFAGLRVLEEGSGSLFARARDTHLVQHSIGDSHYLGIYGGKLTAYRHTADRVLQSLQQQLGQRSAVADTRQLMLTPEPTAPVSTAPGTDATEKGAA